MCIRGMRKGQKRQRQQQTGWELFTNVCFLAGTYVVALGCMGLYSIHPSPLARAGQASERVTRRCEGMPAFSRHNVAAEVN